MVRFRDGDPDAFRILFDQYKKKIVSFCFWYCNNSDIAEELAQEVFLRVYRAKNRYRPTAKFSTWVFQIASNVCLNELRKTRYRYYTQSLDCPQDSNVGRTTDEIADNKSNDPQSQFEDKERNEHIQEAVFRLPERQRIALILRVYHGFSYQEIGLQLRCSESSVKSLIHRGRQNLKNVLLKNPELFDFFNQE